MRGGPDYMTDVVVTGPLGPRAPRAPLRKKITAGPPEVFSAPVEMVLYQTNATGQMFLRRWREKGAVFSKTARVWRVGERLVAEVLFVAPVGPEHQTGCVVQLSVALWENLA